MDSAPFAAREGRSCVFVTERAVTARSMARELTEIAPGIDLEKDVLRHMGFRPRIASEAHGQAPVRAGTDEPTTWTPEPGTARCCAGRSE
jgi:propionate CoA-transferase